MNVHMSVHRNDLQRSKSFSGLKKAKGMPVASLQRPPTMKDVARDAGVSIQTVSAVINGKQGITKVTTERVLQVIEDLGYRPFTVARSLRTGTTCTLALFIPDIANPSFSTIASTAEKCASEQGYSVEFYNTHNDEASERRYIQLIGQRWVDGVIYVSASDTCRGAQDLQKARIPVVAIDRICEDYTGPSVTLDNRRAGRMAAEHLLALGHRRIAHIGGPQNLHLARERQQGWWEAISEAGLEPGPSEVVAEWGCEGGYAAMNRLFDRYPGVTAVFAASDRLAIGAMRAIADRGLAVPGDISIIGLDDIEVSRFQSPPLTTIRQSFTSMATTALSLLLQMLASKELTSSRVVLDPELIVRMSTGSPRAG